MSEKKVSLYDRLPEIYKIKDEEQLPVGQLKNYLALVEEVFGDIHENIESLYHDLFIETSDDWVIPYIGDLLGTSRLTGDPRTLRADVADTIALRRSKGTLGYIERLTYNLTGWGVHCVELRENLVWNQHLNHQRPDEGGKPPYRQLESYSDFSSVVRYKVIRGGTATLRDPAMLSLLNTPFDLFAHIADLKTPAVGNIRYNLPNLAVFLWRLKAYRIPVSKPVSRGVQANPTAVGGEAKFIARFEVHPLGEPVRLFNTLRFDPDRKPPVITRVDEAPGPIPAARLTTDSQAGAPAEYVTIETYDPAATLQTLNLSNMCFQLHLPEPEFTGEIWPNPAGNIWSIRGANLCAWEMGLLPPIKNREVVIDPVIGRIVIGIDTAAEGTALNNHLLLTYTYGAVGQVGAHPISRSSLPQEWNGEPFVVKRVNFHQNPNGLQDALNNIENSTSPIVIEIDDSMIHELDISTVTGTINEDGGDNLRLNRSLIIRAADDQRPIIRLAHPLRFRPTNIKGATPEEQRQFDMIMSHLTIRLQGLYLTRSAAFPAGEPLIARAALNSLEIFDCTLDPGGYKKLDGMRSPIFTSMNLREPYGFANPDDEAAFNQTPNIILQSTISGPLFIDTSYLLFLTDSILDAGKGVDDDPGNSFAVSGADDPVNKWGPPTQINGVTTMLKAASTDPIKLPPTQISGVTIFGRMRVESISGRGGIWVHTLEVLDNQKGCIKFSYFSGKGDRLPQNHGCVKGTEADLLFTSEIFGNPAYGQLAQTTNFRIRERGPNDDAMGAFGFISEAHKWRNLQIRYREFMPVDIRLLMIPVT